jgi:hypothetical protein
MVGIKLIQEAGCRRVSFKFSRSSHQDDIFVEKERFRFPVHRTGIFSLQIPVRWTGKRGAA